MAKAHITPKIINNGKEAIPYCYPYFEVGHHYLTENSDFDPNSVLFGTWKLLEEATYLMSAGINYTAGSTGGEYA